MAKEGCKRQVVFFLFGSIAVTVICQSMKWNYMIIFVKICVLFSHPSVSKKETVRFYHEKLHAVAPCISLNRNHGIVQSIKTSQDPQKSFIHGCTSADCTATSCWAIVPRIGDVSI